MKNGLGSRMKEYEVVTRNYLSRKTPVIIRLDGKAFHTFTRGLKKPFDDVMKQSMEAAATYLCENVQNCKLAYTQSDEISLLLIDYENIDTSAWFNNNVQKMVSVSASMATMAFNQSFSRIVKELEGGLQDTDKEYLELLRNKVGIAMFDSRVFNLPITEVNNYFIWRQQDASRNSVQMVAQSKFSHKELHKKNNSELQEMLFSSYGINWNNLPTYQKRGSCIVKEEYEYLDTTRTRWIVDDIPLFTQDRSYIEKHL